MSEIDLDGSWDESRGVVRQMLQNHQDTLHGNGREGMLTAFNAFVTEYRTTEANRQKFQEKRDAEIKDALEARDKRLNRWLAIITVLLLAFGAWLTFRDSLRKTSSVTPPAVVSSSQKQESGIQPINP